MKANVDVIARAAAGPAGAYRRQRAIKARVLALIFCCVLPACISGPVLADSISPAASLKTARQYHTATQLLDGRVLVTGGADVNMNLLASTEIYDPTSDTWVAGASMGTARQFHTATLLPGGTVLVAGGMSGGIGNYTFPTNAELYDPTTDTWSAAGNLATGRAGPTANLLGNVLVSADVLLAGGLGSDNQTLNSVERYDVASNSWSSVGSMATARFLHTATVMPSGRMLVVGGQNMYGTVSSAEIYDPASNTWSATRNGPKVMSHAASLKGSRVWITGGFTITTDGSGRTDVWNVPVVYDETVGDWLSGGQMVQARGAHTANYSSRAEDIVVIGGSAAAPIALSEYSTETSDNPALTGWSGSASLAVARSNHTTTALANGKLLVVGGAGAALANGVTPPLASAELYQPVFHTLGLPDFAPTPAVTPTSCVERIGTTGNGLIDVTVRITLGNGRYSTRTNIFASGKLPKGYLGTPRCTGREAARKSASATADPNAPVQYVFAQLTPDGWEEVVDNQLIPFASVPAGTTEVDATLFAGVDFAQMPGAPICVGYGTSAAAMAANGTVANIYTVPGTAPGVASSCRTATIQAATAAGTQAITPDTGYWWNPAEGGRGFTIEQNPTTGNVFFATYLYTASGSPVWYAAGPGQMSGNTFSGPLLAYSGGQTLTSAFKPASAGVSPGAVSITFTDNQNAILTWPGGTIPITRYPIVPGGTDLTPSTTQPQSGYWWNPAEGGRGYTIEVQNNTAFIAAYMYDTSGNPAWYAAGPATLTGNNTFQGNWTTYAGGQTLTGIYQSPTSTSNAGSLTVQFASAMSGTLTLPDGRQIPIQRFVF